MTQPGLVTNLAEPLDDPAAFRDIQVDETHAGGVNTFSRQVGV
jgi:hypothetical protein